MERIESVTQGLTPLPGGYHPFGVWVCDALEYRLALAEKMNLILHHSPRQ